MAWEGWVLLFYPMLPDSPMEDPGSAFCRSRSRSDMICPGYTWGLKILSIAYKITAVPIVKYRNPCFIITICNSEFVSVFWRWIYLEIWIFCFMIFSCYIYSTSSFKVLRMGQHWSWVQSNPQEQCCTILNILRLLVLVIPD